MAFLAAKFLRADMGEQVAEGRRSDEALLLEREENGSGLFLGESGRSGEGKIHIMVADYSSERERVNGDAVRVLTAVLPSQFWAPDAKI